MIEPGCYTDAHALVGNPNLSAGEGDTGHTGDGDGSNDSGSEDSEDTGDTTTGDESSLDLPDNQHDPQACMTEGLDAPLPCDSQSPSLVFDPVVAWRWDGEGDENSIIVTPLVANFDDDNFDGEVDLCDTPEIVAITVDLPIDKSDPIPAGHIYLLDSVSGETKLRFPTPVDPTTTPVLADLDADGEPELLAMQRSEDLGDPAGQRRVIAFNADGSVAWAAATWVTHEGSGSLSVADLDADGSPEILAPNQVLAADGGLLWQPLELSEDEESIPLAADLDLDGTMEVLFGRSAYEFDGEERFVMDLPGNKTAGLTAIANFDADPYPEIYVQSNQHRIFEHDGTPKATCGGNGNGHRPVSIADIDGDGHVELLVQKGNHLRALVTTLPDIDFDPENDTRPLDCDSAWSLKLDGDKEGATTTFDFLADGTAETIHADQDSVRFVDAEGEQVAEIPRRSRPSLSVPIVVDADNDGAAEIIIVGSEPVGGDSELEERATLMLIQNADDRFAATRRIWNQHAYHATNVREDAGIPMDSSYDWETNNSFRSNPAPSYQGSLCQGSLD